MKRTNRLDNKACERLKLETQRLLDAEALCDADGQTLLDEACAAMRMLDLCDDERAHRHIRKVVSLTEELVIAGYLRLADGKAILNASNHALGGGDTKTLNQLHRTEGTKQMASIERKNFSNPDETRSITGGRIDVINVGDLQAMRVQFDPGWKWSTAMKSKAGTDSCQVPHLLHVVQGQMDVRMDDGQEVRFGPGDVGVIPPGHDAWIVGNETFVAIDFQGGAIYAK